MTDPLAYGEGFGGSVIILAALVAVEPEHLPALIAMLQEVQRRIEAGDAL